jgi:hypothetical protein
MRNKSLGAILLSLALLTMVAYFWLLFLAPQDIPYWGRTASEWAVLIPVVIIVYAFLIVVAWIGWALASTAPPLPVPVDFHQD